MINHAHRSKTELGQLIVLSMISLSMLGQAELLTGNDLHFAQGANP